MEFPAKLRKSSESLVITIPVEVVTAMKLKEMDICKFSCEKADYKDAEKE